MTPDALRRRLRSLLRPASSSSAASDRQGARQGNKRPAGCALCHRIAMGLGGLLERLRRRLRRRAPADRSGERELVRTFQRRPYPGSRNRRYRLHLPAGFRASGRYPLVMVLHGCRQTENDIREVSGFDRVADEAGFVAVYPFVTSYAGLRGRNCWGWWFDDEIHRGAGEVEDLWRIVEEVCRDYPIERQCIHVAGLSSGGGMAVAMMVGHAQHIAAGAVVAGVPFAESAGAVRMMRVVRPWFRPIGEIRRAMQRAMGEQRRPVPIFIVHSDGDETVPLQAADNIRESWQACFDLPRGQPLSRSNGTTRGTPWEHCVYADTARKPIIETLFLSGPGHGWYGGRAGAYSYPDAPDISRLMWDFFRRHRLTRHTLPRDTAA